MTRRTWILPVALLAASGCGTPSASLKDDQKVVLTDDTPIYALVMEAQPEDFLLNIEATADKPIDFAFVGGNASVDEAISQRRAGKAISAPYRKTAKSHSFESIIAGHSTAVIVLRHEKGAGPTAVQITSKRAPYTPPKS